jgi:hypothetical protein
MGTIIPLMLASALVGGVKDYAVKLGGEAGFKGEADDVIAGAPPTGGQRSDFRVGCELGILPGLAVVMGVVFPEDIPHCPVKNIDLGSISGDGTGAIAVGGYLSPLGIIRAGTRVGDLLVIELIAVVGSNTMHAALAVEGYAVMVVGLAAGVKACPSEALDTGLVIIDFGLDVGKAVGFLLGG